MPPPSPPPAISPGKTEPMPIGLVPCFAKAMATWTRVEAGEVRWGSAEFSAALRQFSACSDLVKREGRFSANEEADDVKTADLPYLLIDFFLGKLLMRTTDIDRRAVLLRSGCAHLSSFLQRLRALKLLSREDAAAFDRLEGTADGTAAPLTAHARREAKMAGWRREKETREQLAALAAELAASEKSGFGGADGAWEALAAGGAGAGDEERTRQWLLLTLRGSAAKAVQDIEMAAREQTMLAHRAALARADGGPKPADDRMRSGAGGRARPGARRLWGGARGGGERRDDRRSDDSAERNARSGISLARIGPSALDGSLQVRREVLRDGVFRPAHNLPTMSLEDFADAEMADAIARSEAAKRAQEEGRGPVLKYRELVAEGKEDDARLVDLATYKDRAWDDWKDAHQKGAGNSKRI
jgi:hypothetical protein